MSVMRYKTEITLYNSYFDANDNLSVKSILSIFQDVASIHAEEIGVGYKTMLEKNLYWVLSRIKIDILKMPQINEQVVVETWPHEKGRIDFDRDLRILSKTGEVLVIGTSKWCVIDVVNRRLQRSDNVNYVGEVCSEVNYEEKLNKISLPEEELQESFKYTVIFSDIDHNQHMNNTNYSNLVVSAIKNKTISHFEINFINECILGEELTINTFEDENKEYVVGKVDESVKFVSCAY